MSQDYLDLECERKSKILCKDLVTKGACRHGDKCHYMHNDQLVAIERKRLDTEKIEYDKISLIIGCKPEERTLEIIVKKFDNSLIYAMTDSYYKQLAYSKLTPSKNTKIGDLGEKSQYYTIEEIINKYIFEKYGIDSDTYFMLWYNRIKNHRFFKCKKGYMINIDEQSIVTIDESVLPRDDVLIAGYAIGKFCYVSLQMK
jgi:hypothetical protein